MAPLVSVLMPVWNSERFLLESVQSVLAQTLDDLELIVADDGSTDGSLALLAAIPDPRLRVIRCPHRGISATMNAALAAAQGEFAARLDSDDLWQPDTLATLVGELRARPGVDVVYARAQGIDPAGHKLDTYRGRAEPYPGETLRSILEDDFTAQIALVTRRRCFELVGGWDENLATSEDWDLQLRLARHFRFAFLDRVVSYFRVHPASLTATPGSRDDFIAHRTRVLDKLWSDPALDPSVRAFERQSYRDAYLWMGNLYLGARRPRQALAAFTHAVGVADHPVRTVGRAAWVALSRHVLARRPAIRKLIERAVHARSALRARRAVRQP
jgi:glycosyltransferase involved in cell wall biosynthesis